MTDFDPEDLPLDSPSADDGQEGMFEHFRLIADKGQAPLRVDKFIATHQEGTSRSRVQQAIRLGYVLVNDKPAKANSIIRPCDVIKFLRAPGRGNPSGKHSPGHRL